MVTGVGRLAGIGAGIARRLAADGWDLVLTYWQDYDSRMPWGVQPDDVERLAAELEATGARVLALPADLEDPQAVDRLMESVAEQAGTLRGWCSATPSPWTPASWTPPWQAGNGTSP